ncbi:cytochrome b/b6 domain-containing protein [Phenylobacterium sp.]|uniref:cytochrome b/b6 domain-containing protein n=1 Tax=Phenylobacterium sp. TaxID=1871053 RepID=UPI0030F42390
MPPTMKVLVYRHSVITRLTHWINVVALVLLLMSGLQIFNAHPALYWGHTSTFAQPWVSMTSEERGDRMIGLTKVGPVTLETTGLFGFSGGEKRGFPAWATAPGYRNLADGRHWHFFFAWLFVFNGLVYLSANILSGHIRRDLLPTRDDLAPRNLWREVVTHARLRFPKGEEARRYNALQKLSYGGIVLILLPLMVLTGLTMSPAVDAGQPWLPAVFGGRQSARTIHFICAGLIVAFVLVHVAMVLLSGVWNNLRSMITGRYAIDLEGDAR